MCIEAFKRRGSFGYRQMALGYQPRDIILNSYTTEELKNKAVVSLNNIVCITLWSLVMHSDYFEWNHLYRFLSCNIWSVFSHLLC